MHVNVLEIVHQVILHEDEVASWKHVELTHPKQLILIVVLG